MVIFPVWYGSGRKPCYGLPKDRDLDSFDGSEKKKVRT